MWSLVGLAFIIIGILVLESNRRSWYSSMPALNGINGYTLGFGLAAFGFLFLGFWIIFVALILIMAWNVYRRR